MKQLESEQQFESLGQSATVSELAADWCSDCGVVEPDLSELEARCPMFDFVSADRDRFVDICIENGITDTPNFLVYKDGELFESCIKKERKPIEQIDAFLAQYVQFRLEKDGVIFVFLYHYVLTYCKLLQGTKLGVLHMNTFQMRDKLKERLGHLDIGLKFDREGEILRIYQTDNDKGITTKLNAIVAKYEDKKERIVDEIVYYVDEAIAQTADKALESISSSQIMPVIRTTSFNKETKQSVPSIYDGHTTEAAVHYAVGLGKSYRLIDESMLRDLKLTK